jgi:hypothetical protein
MNCWLAQFSATSCDGQLVRCHLIPRQLLAREGHDALIEDRRTWVPGCGGLTGIGGHHGELDTSRKLRIPLWRIPTETLLLLEEIGLGWWLEREYA